MRPRGARENFLYDLNFLYDFEPGCRRAYQGWSPLKITLAAGQAHDQRGSNVAR